MKLASKTGMKQHLFNCGLFETFGMRKDSYCELIAG